MLIYVVGSFLSFLCAFSLSYFNTYMMGILYLLNEEAGTEMVSNLPKVS